MSLHRLMSRHQWRHRGDRRAHLVRILARQWRRRFGRKTLRKSYQQRRPPEFP